MGLSNKKAATVLFGSQINDIHYKYTPTDSCFETEFTA